MSAMFVKIKIVLAWPGSDYTNFHKNLNCLANCHCQITFLHNKKFPTFNFDTRKSSSFEYLMFLAGKPQIPYQNSDSTYFLHKTYTFSSHTKLSSLVSWPKSYDKTIFFWLPSGFALPTPWRKSVWKPCFFNRKGKKWKFWEPVVVGDRFVCKNQY